MQIALLPFTIIASFFSCPWKRCTAVECSRPHAPRPFGSLDGSPAATSSSPILSRTNRSAHLPSFIHSFIYHANQFACRLQHGAGFLDGSFMQLDKDLQRMTYIDQQLTEWPFLVAEDGDVPEALRQRVHQMWDVVDQLHGLNVLGIDKGNRQVCPTEISKLD